MIKNKVRVYAQKYGREIAETRGVVCRSIFWPRNGCVIGRSLFARVNQVIDRIITAAALVNNVVTSGNRGQGDGSCINTLFEAHVVRRFNARAVNARKNGCDYRSTN